MSGRKSKRRAWEGPTTANGKTTPRTEEYKRIYEKIFGKKVKSEKKLKELKKNRKED